MAIANLSVDSVVDWKIKFESHEEFVSLHRWNWLLRPADGNQLLDFDDGLALVRSWLAVNGMCPSGDASESYTVGERISNVCLFARERTGDWFTLPDDIQEAPGSKLISCASTRVLTWKPNESSNQ